MHSVANNAEETCLKNHNGVDAAEFHYHGDLSSLNAPAQTVKPIIEEKSSTTSHPQHAESELPDVEDKDDFPEGGARAWSVVFGSFCGSFAVFGIINSTAIFQEYFSKHQLKDYSPSQIGWIFSLGLFLTFFCGVPIGPIFDARGPKVLVFCGSILLVASMMLLGLCTRKFRPGA